jgi:hypothetical protein
MRPIQTTRPQHHHWNGIHPVLRSFADEFCGTLAHLIAYMGALALLAILGIHLWDQWPTGAPVEASAKAGWGRAERSYPAFAVSPLDLPEKTETYEILRHPEGGRKDIIRWLPQGENPVAELEIYRPGGEAGEFAPLASGSAAEVDAAWASEAEAAGVIESKFGTISLLRLAGNANQDGRSCLGFIKRFDEANLRISGWSCQGDTLPARRAAIGCTLNHLILLTAGNDPKLAELFARAELKRGSYAPAAASAISTDWVTGTEDPRLRGSL